MKKILYFSFLVCLTGIFSSCEEEGPYINFTPTSAVQDTTYISLPAPSAEPRHVLIEEVTGVRCPNCPKAQAEAKAISDQYLGRISIMTLHPLNKLNALTRPFDKAIGDAHTSAYDFRTDAAAQLFEMTGLSSALPIGNVDRKLFQGESARNIDYQKWAAYVTSELSEATPVNIDLTARNIGDSVEIKLKLSYTKAVTDSHYVTLAILESDMEDVQESKDGSGNVIYVENYIHNHVLRAIVTDYYGDLLKATLEPGRVFEKTYRYKRDGKWNAANLDVVAFVHLNTTKMNVIHTKDVKVN